VKKKREGWEDKLSWLFANGAVHTQQYITPIHGTVMYLPLSITSWVLDFLPLQQDAVIDLNHLIVNACQDHFN
jgi:hypothetical protein